MFKSLLQYTFFDERPSESLLLLPPASGPAIILAGGVCERDGVALSRPGGDDQRAVQGTEGGRP